MNKKLFNSILIAIGSIGVLAGITMATPVHEPAIMFFFGTGLVGVARIIKK